MTGIVEEYIKTIKDIFPSDISNVTLHENGDDFHVIEINHKWMFRFPRNEVSQKALGVEKAFLTRFKTISPLPVPDHHYMGDDFVGYPKIDGTSLTIELFQSLSKRGWERIAHQLGQFLSAVHNFPVDDAKRIGMTEGWDGWYIKILQNFRERIAPALSSSARGKGLAYLEQMQAEKFESKVIHGDFSLADHVFFDERGEEICGVIDFADVTIDDPAHDFQNIVEYGGGEFFEAVMRQYQSTEDPELFRRTKLRIDVRPFFEASSSMLFGFEERFKERMGFIETRYG